MHKRLRCGKTLKSGLAAVAIIAAFALTLGAAKATIIVNPAMTIDRQVVVQLIQAQNDSGTVSATVLGNVSQRLSIENALDQIWAQAGIDVSVISTVTTYRSSFALNNNGNTSGTRPESDFDTIFMQAGAAGKLNPGNVINTIFVDYVPGFTLLDENTSAGLADLPGSHITLFVGDNLLTFQNGLDVIASVFAHEIGHNLGLDHVAGGSANLMAEFNAASEQLTAAQISIARSSSLVAVIPEPGTILLFAPGMLLVLTRRRAERRR